jgi:chemotaxis signal transduction protein
MAFPYLIVRARGRLCALPVEQVVETLRLPGLLPEASEVKGWMGTTMLRGELVAVLELGALLGFAEPDAASLPNSLTAPVARIPARAVAVRLGSGPAVDSAPPHRPLETCTLFAVDEVVGVQRLEPHDLQRIALPGGGELPMGRFDAGFLRLLDASGLLSASGLSASGLSVLGSRSGEASLATRARDAGAAA